MEQWKGPSTGGLLAQLEVLEARARRAAVQQEEEEQQEEKLARLKARVQELRLRRDELRAKLELQQKGPPGPGGAAAQPDARALLEGKIRSLKSMLQIFYLTGISGKLTKRGVCFCLSTAFEGTYLESFHLELVGQPRVGVGRHSVPPFLPLQQLASRYLPTDPRRFLSLLFDHLNAYAGRKFQADQLQEHFSEQIEGTLQRNSLCNLLVFSYSLSGKSQSFPLRARLLYGDLCSSLPTQVTVSCAPEAPAALAATAAAHLKLFGQVALHKAFSSFSSPGDSMHGAP